MFNTNNIVELYSLRTSLESVISNEEKKYKEVKPYKRDKAELITCKEAAKLYPIGEQKFRELCRSTNKNFPSIKVGCRYYIVKNKLDGWFMENAIGGRF